jgi:hypothetical protein
MKASVLVIGGSVLGCMLLFAYTESERKDAAILKPGSPEQKAAVDASIQKTLADIAKLKAAGK